jgi:hypothetical protein
MDFCVCICICVFVFVFAFVYVCVCLCGGEGQLVSEWPLESPLQQKGVTSSSQAPLLLKRRPNFKTCRRAENGSR